MELLQILKSHWLYAGGYGIRPYDGIVQIEQSHWLYAGGYGIRPYKYGYKFLQQKSAKVTLH